MSVQYACHFCGKREGSVMHLDFFSCKVCQRKVRDHSLCTPDCSARQTELPKTVLSDQPRTYGKDNTPENPNHCIETLTFGVWGYQCTRKRSNGEYCTQHAKKHQLVGDQP